MSEKEKSALEAPDTPIAAAKAPIRKFIYNGMELPDVDPSMKPEQIRDVWAGNYPELQNAKVKGPDKDDEGNETYTFTRSVGHLG